MTTVALVPILWLGMHTARLCLAGTGGGGASQICIPRRSLGTRGFILLIFISLLWSSCADAPSSSAPSQPTAPSIPEIHLVNGHPYVEGTWYTRDEEIDLEGARDPDTDVWISGKQETLEEDQTPVWTYSFSLMDGERRTLEIWAERRECQSEPRSCTSKVLEAAFVRDSSPPPAPVVLEVGSELWDPDQEEPCVVKTLPFTVVGRRESGSIVLARLKDSRAFHVVAGPEQSASWYWVVGDEPAGSALAGLEALQASQPASFVLASEDRLGNRGEETELSVVLEVEVQPPVILEPPPGVPHLTREMEVSLRGTKAAGTGISVIMDGGELEQAAVAPDQETGFEIDLVFELEDEGAHSLRLQAFDELGNLSAAASLDLQLDFTPPAAPIPDQARLEVASSPVRISGTKSMDSGVVLFRDIQGEEQWVNESAVDQSARFVLQTDELEPGENLFRLYARDVVDNRSEPVEVEVFLTR